MIAEETSIEGCYIITPRIFKDERGYFIETFNNQTFFEKTGIATQFVQDNQSKSSVGVLRGLHFQQGGYAQAKLVRVIQGSVLDICVDLRPNSKTLGQYVSVVLSGDNFKQLYVPRGFAHGFVVLEDETIFSYKCDNFYNKNSEGGIIYNDPDIAIDWRIPEEKLILSDKDKHLPTLKEYLAK
ncbi:dTDP-4-dehydrorhamnose 3,5-epimerase [Aegicerativicinus sediminis]|uniref:dTDP-4-dehydrorhamnose 3,5-epimerase n=1 Tax=Aegicerativicinus sediminis TaxID=2893202 RepID=UPI001E5C203E|nr:dTDP-4-dehydrorhamnose 3,5-epimerase [Aegicerativicinus sediminis]